MKEHMVHIFSGESYQDFSIKLCDHLQTTLGKVTHRRFKDNEYQADFGVSVSNKPCVIIQGLNNSSNFSPNENCMTLFHMCRGLVEAGCCQLLVVSPYTVYARQDKKDEKRSAVGIKLFADLLQESCNNIPLNYITSDLHAGQSVSCFGKGTKVDNMFNEPYLTKYIELVLANEFNISANQFTIVSPDAGGAKRAERIANLLDCGYLFMSKIRSGAGQIKSLTLSGDIQNKHCVIVDDMCDSGGTLIKAADKLKQSGAQSVSVVVCHGVFSQDAMTKLDNSSIDNIATTNTCNHNLQLNNPVCYGEDNNLTVYKIGKKINIIDVSWLFAEAVRRRIGNESVSLLFDYGITSQQQMTKIENSLMNKNKPITNHNRLDLAHKSRYFD